jgi:L-asparaginase II
MSRAAKVDRAAAALLSLTRGDFTDAVHYGSIAVVSSDGELVSSAGDPGMPAVLRSALKPIQLLAVVASGAVERFGLSGEELAVAAASHSAEPEHLEAVRSILGKIGKSEADLRCGVHPPFAPHVAAAMAIEGVQPGPLHNNCSGKHAAMLAACLARGWPTEGYERLEHPLQQENLHRLARFAGLAPGEVGTVIDGCGVPAFVLPLWRSALAFARLADPSAAPEEDRGAAAVAWEAITGNPVYGSGRVGRLEAPLMELGGGGLLAKVGAEGFYAVAMGPGVVGGESNSPGCGLTLKLEDGITFNRATDPIVVAALMQLGVLSEGDVDRLSEFRPQEVLNCRGEAVGKQQVLFNLG